MTIINNVIIEGLNCNKNKYIVLHGIEKSLSISNIKNIIYDRFKIPNYIYYFIYQSHRVDNKDTLDTIKYQAECTLHVRFRHFKPINIKNKSFNV